jgi:hypothetical protein
MISAVITQSSKRYRWQGGQAPVSAKILCLILIAFNLLARPMLSIQSTQAGLFFARRYVGAVGA